MEKDYIDSLDYLALGSRLKRLSDRLISDATELYQYAGTDFQPRWFTLISLISEKGCVGIVEASNELQISQPAVSQFSRELLKKGYIVKKSCENDSRKKYLTLTPEGEKAIKELKNLWSGIRHGAKELCDETGVDILKGIKELEKALNRKSLNQRSKEFLK